MMQPTRVAVRGGLRRRGPGARSRGGPAECCEVPRRPPEGALDAVGEVGVAAVSPCRRGSTWRSAAHGRSGSMWKRWTPWRGRCWWRRLPPG